jgi:hypothetical protein
MVVLWCINMVRPLLQLVEESMKMDIGGCLFTVDALAVKLHSAVATQTMPGQQSCRSCDEGGLKAMFPGLQVVADDW